MSKFNLISRSEFMLIEYAPDYDILKNSWLKRSIADEIAKEELFKWVEIFKPIKPKYLLTDMTGGFIILPDMQEWMAHYLHPIVSPYITKWAFLLHSDVFSSVSVQMTVEVIQDLGFEREFFDMNDEEEAISWLIVGE